MEKLVVEIDKELFNRMVTEYNEARFVAFQIRINQHYTIKEIKVEDDFFKDDPVWHTMRKESNDLYKRLKQYEFNQRNKIKK